MAKKPSESTSEWRGVEAFNRLRAEDEEWLAEVFVSPPEFDMMIGPRSIIIFGDEGSGKTALCRALTGISTGEDGKPKRLLVEWGRPLPVLPVLKEGGDSQSVEVLLEDVLDRCALALLRHTCAYPQDFHEAGDLAKEAAVWFTRTFLQGDFEMRTRRFPGEFGDTASAILGDFAGRSVRDVLLPDAPSSLVIGELVETLRSIGLDGAWVLTDIPSLRDETDTRRQGDVLAAFLSALNQFEVDGFVYKMVVPSNLEHHLAEAGGIDRRRLDKYMLYWPHSKLIDIVNKHLVFATGGKVNSLEELCEAESLKEWLERCGGRIPGSWLKHVRPLVAAYGERASEGNFGPIDEDSWKEIRMRHLPNLELDVARGLVRVGGRVVDDIPDTPYKILRYLCERPGQVCTKKELYYRAYLGLESEPASFESTWDLTSSHSGLIDTAVWRLREAVEPDPKDPIFVITHRGKGVSLQKSVMRHRDG